MTNAVVADGEAVWSWRPDAGVKFVRNFSRATVARKPGHRGEHGISRKPLRRESRMPPLDLYARVRFFVHFCTRDRGCSAHPAFPAPSSLRGREINENLAQNMRRDCEVMHGDPPSLHAHLRVVGRGRGWGVYQLARLAASLRRPPDPSPPLRGGRGGVVRDGVLSENRIGNLRPYVVADAKLALTPDD
jgi:hypothetical protein